MLPPRICLPASLLTVSLALYLFRLSSLFTAATSQSLSLASFFVLHILLLSPKIHSCLYFYSCFSSFFLQLLGLIRLFGVCLSMCVCVLEVGTSAIFREHLFAINLVSCILRRLSTGSVSQDIRWMQTTHAHAVWHIGTCKVCHEWIEEKKNGKNWMMKFIRRNFGKCLCNSNKNNVQNCLLIQAYEKIKISALVLFTIFLSKFTIFPVFCNFTLQRRRKIRPSHGKNLPICVCTQYSC